MVSLVGQFWLSKTFYLFWIITWNSLISKTKYIYKGKCAKSKLAMSMLRTGKLAEEVKDQLRTLVLKVLLLALGHLHIFLTWNSLISQRKYFS